ncbi:DEAD/DEAH box helicase [Rhizohabitans arisaemae]|uniref:DEAD/DEAH box helicase n=1 Tax=Rhizohabitans arisaemae TaxID=2720610 RepID=UPI0024B22E91|nr:DEAD/DEAH box helicase [Rhizohabitans arisaemae]
MTTSRPSGSDPAAPSGAYGLLHPAVRRWIWDEGWTGLRDIQETAIPEVLAGRTDVLIGAATASGKTEAAFLPICSALVSEPPAVPGFSAIYVSPLKALINDQYDRLDRLCTDLDIPVARWHGDVGSDRKHKLTENPRGILLITPESLEALFVLRGWKMSHLTGALRYVVVDEAHSFIGTERGAQLQSLLHRLDLAARRRVPRIGLSATLGDMRLAAEFLRPGDGGKVTLITSDSDAQALRLLLRGYVEREPDPAETRDEPDEIADHLFTTLRGSHNLIFANSRRDVEHYTDLLSRRCERAGVPGEFVPHHGNLSKDIREHAESRLKDRSRPVTAVCTATLELGIDIGAVASVAQIGAAPGVAALRQRLGRSGRRGEPAVLGLHIRERELIGTSPPGDELREELVQAIAVVELLLRRWYEPPPSAALHLSTLVQQLLSLIAQHGGVSPSDAYRTLCVQGPFRAVDPGVFGAFLRDAGAADLIRQEPDGLLLHGTVGERLVNHHSFYAAFATPVEYRVVTERTTLGTFPMDHLLPDGALLIFAGRRWKILKVDTEARTIEVAPSSGGRPPRFTGSGMAVHDRVRREMRRIYQDTAVPVYLDATAQRLLEQGRATYRRFGLRSDSLVGWGKDTLFFPFRGDVIMTTIGLALLGRGVEIDQEGAGMTLNGTSPATAHTRLRELASAAPPAPEALAALVPDKRLEKHDHFLGEDLLTRGYAARHLDVPGAWSALAELTAGGRHPD